MTFSLLSINIGFKSLEKLIKGQKRPERPLKARKAIKGQKRPS